MSNIPLTKELVNNIKTFPDQWTNPSGPARSTIFKFKKRYSNGDWTLADGNMVA
jgi:hypothetical protein